MNQIFELNAANVETVIGGDDFDVRHQEGRVQTRVNKARFDLPACDADLM